MKISTSMLSINDNYKKYMDDLNGSLTDYFHLDIMDGLFVENNSIEKMDELLKYNNKPLDIHLMVNNPIKYIDKYSFYKPSFITIHAELDNVSKIIKYIKSRNINVGVAIKPSTNLDAINSYIDELDLILVMSVEPGKGGQDFISNSKNKIDELFKLRKQNNYKYLIEVDGGINDKTINDVLNADIVVSGSFIVNGDINVNIVKLKNI